MPILDKDFFTEQGYLQPRQLPDGSWAALMPLLYTTGLCLGLRDQTYERRFCFERPDAAVRALNALESKDDEPTGWIARRP
ncbi:hypothetical protein GALL_504630 [mine drainage metagenome]|uniref:Uncharacterized protein n=1 Tax=mine drainage metagenome TaxID=410659 RepID=A0A1J5PRP1_9ZZZZ